jgi:hypothetical protein
MSRLRRWWPEGIYLLLVLGIMLPVLATKPGYLFLLDMVWAPHLSAHLTVSAGLPITLVLWLLSWVFATDLLQKVLLGAVMWLAAWSAYRFAHSYAPNRWAFVAGIFYLFNPFVYERLVAGQWQVLLGYAVLPFVITLFWQWLQKPSMKGWTWFAVAMALYPILSLHFAYMSGLFFTLFGAFYFATNRKLVQLDRRLAWGLVLPVLFLAVNWWWLQDSSSSSTISHLTAGDLNGFRTATDGGVGIWVNVISLYGFWLSEYFLPKDFFSWWWVVGLITAILAGYGLLRSVKEKNDLLTVIGLWAIVAVFLSVGVSSGVTAGTTSFLAHHLPGYTGLRDTEKWSGWVALGIATLIPVAGEAIERKLRNWMTLYQARIAGPGFILLLPALAAGPLLWGASSQLQPVNYPAGWVAVKEYLNQKDAQVLVLPWHEYLSLNFAGDHYASNPAKDYFPGTVVTSDRTDNVTLDSQSATPLDTEVNNLVNAETSKEQFVNWLKSRGYDYILLLRVDDFERYQPLLDESATLTPAVNRPSIELYRIR